MEPCTQGGRRGRSAARAMERAREQVLPSRPSEPSGPADTVALDFRPPELGENTLLLFKAPVWGAVPWAPNYKRKTFRRDIILDSQRACCAPLRHRSANPRDEPCRVNSADDSGSRLLSTFWFSDTLRCAACVVERGCSGQPLLREVTCHTSRGTHSGHSLWPDPCSAHCQLRLGVHYMLSRDCCFVLICELEESCHLYDRTVRGTVC